MTATINVWILYTMILGMGTPHEVDAFLTQAACEKTKTDARELINRALAMNENAELRKVKIVGCEAPVEIPVPDIAEVQLYK